MILKGENDGKVGGDECTVTYGVDDVLENKGETFLWWRHDMKTLSAI